MLTGSKEFLLQAKQNKYAIPATDFVDQLSAEAYTEVMGSHGATDNSVAKIYDRVFNWTGTHPEGTTGIILQPDKIAQDFLSGAGPDSPGTITINKENHA